MSTISQFFQPPLYWQEFEQLAVGLLRQVYNVPDARSYGRPGQAQNGVDVYGRSRYGMIGIQCKRLSDRDENGNPYPGGPISRKFLLEAANDSLAFKPKLSLWILATTARRDTRVQGYFDELNQEWETKQIKRTAILWSWDECITYLNTFPTLQRWYYQDVIQVRATRDLDEIILRTIATAFARPAFEVPLHCETPDDFIQALKDTQKALRTGELVDRESRHVIRKALGGWRDVEDPSFRNGLSDLDKSIKLLRSQIDQGLKNNSIQRINGFLQFADIQFAKSVETLRSKCLDTLNVVLASAGLPIVD